MFLFAQNVKKNIVFNCSLSSRDRTPVKNPVEQDTTMKESVKRRLSLTDTQESEFSALRNKRTSLPSHMSLCVAKKSSSGQSSDNLANCLQALSQEQLVRLIMELVHEQENDMLRKNEKLCDIIAEKIAALDIQPLIQKLIALRHHIYVTFALDSIHLAINAFLVLHHILFFFSKHCVQTLFEKDTPLPIGHKCQYVFRDLFLQKALHSQGLMLQESQHWISLMSYVFEAWRIVEELEEWNHKTLGCFTFNCSKILSSFCAKALEGGNFETSALEVYIKR